MNQLSSFLDQHAGFLISIMAITCVLFGRIWSNILNWGTITHPNQLIRSGRSYKVINLYLPKGWTDSWEVGSIVCFESVQRRFFIKYRKEIYVSGDRIRFTDDGPGIGSFYEASYSNKSTGTILMKPVKIPA
jgi:hypothetical protein